MDSAYAEKPIGRPRVASVLNAVASRLDDGLDERELRTALASLQVVGDTRLLVDLMQGLGAPPSPAHGRTSTTSPESRYLSYRDGATLVPADAITKWLLALPVKSPSKPPPPPAPQHQQQQQQQDTGNDSPAAIPGQQQPSAPQPHPMANISHAASDTASGSSATEHPHGPTGDSAALPTGQSSPVEQHVQQHPAPEEPQQRLEEEHVEEKPVPDASSRSATRSPEPESALATQLQTLISQHRATDAELATAVATLLQAHPEAALQRVDVRRPASSSARRQDQAQQVTPDHSMLAPPAKADVVTAATETDEPEAVPIAAASSPLPLPGVVELASPPAMSAVTATPSGISRNPLAPFVSTLAASHIQRSGMSAWTLDAAVVFIDISDYSTVANALAQVNPFELSRAVNDYFGRLVDCVRSAGGDVLKFAGDAMIVAWHDPRNTVARNLQAACACALELLEGHGTFPVPPMGAFGIHAGVSVGSITSRVLVPPARDNATAMPGAFHFVSGEPLAHVAQGCGAVPRGKIAIHNDAVALLARELPDVVLGTKTLVPDEADGNGSDALSSDADVEDFVQLKSISIRGEPVEEEVELSAAAEPSRDAGDDRNAVGPHVTSVESTPKSSPQVGGERPPSAFGSSGTSGAGGSVTQTPDFTAHMGRGLPPSGRSADGLPRGPSVHGSALPRRPVPASRLKHFVASTERTAGVATTLPWLRRQGNVLNSCVTSRAGLAASSSAASRAYVDELMFVPPRVSEHLAIGTDPLLMAQMRDLIVLFIRMGGADFGQGSGGGGPDPTVWFLEVHDVLRSHGCAIVQILDDDKGVHVVAAFNLYAIAENAASRCIDVAVELRRCRSGAYIGAAAGTVFCGVLGGRAACQWDITGNACVRACRLMQHAVAEDIPVVLDESVYELATDRSHLAPADTIRVKGTDQPLPVYTVTGEPAAALLPAQAVVTTTASASITAPTTQNQHALPAAAVVVPPSEIGSVVGPSAGEGEEPESPAPAARKSKSLVTFDVCAMMSGSGELPAPAGAGGDTASATATPAPAAASATDEPKSASNSPRDSGIGVPIPAATATQQQQQPRGAAGGGPAPDTGVAVCLTSTDDLLFAFDAPNQGARRDTASTSVMPGARQRSLVGIRATPNLGARKDRRQAAQIPELHFANTLSTYVHAASIEKVRTVVAAPPQIRSPASRRSGPPGLARSTGRGGGEEARSTAAPRRTVVLRGPPCSGKFSVILNALEGTEFVPVVHTADDFQDSTPLAVLRTIATWFAASHNRYIACAALHVLELLNDECLSAAFNAGVDLVRTLVMRQKRVAIVVRRLQYVDRGSASLLRVLHEEFATAPTFALLITASPVPTAELAHTFLGLPPTNADLNDDAVLGAADGATHLCVEAVSASEASAIVCHALRSRVELPVVRWIFEKCAGIAGWMVELCEYLQRTGCVSAVAGGAVTVRRPTRRLIDGKRWPEISPRLAVRTMQLVDQLNPPQLMLCKTVAAITEQPDIAAFLPSVFSAAQAMMDVPVSLPDVEYLQQLQLLRLVPHSDIDSSVASREPDAVVFFTPPMRDVVAAMLTPTQRRQINVVCADTYASTHRMASPAQFLVRARHRLFAEQQKLYEADIEAGWRLIDEKYASGEFRRAEADKVKEKFLEWMDCCPVNTAEGFMRHRDFCKWQGLSDTRRHSVAAIANGGIGTGSGRFGPAVSPIGALTSKQSRRNLRNTSAGVAFLSPGVLKPHGGGGSGGGGGSIMPPGSNAMELSVSRNTVLYNLPDAAIERVAARHELYAMLTHDKSMAVGPARDYLDALITEIIALNECVCDAEARLADMEISAREIDTSSSEQSSPRDSPRQQQQQQLAPAQNLAAEASASRVAATDAGTAEQPCPTVPSSLVKRYRAAVTDYKIILKAQAQPFEPNPDDTPANQIAQERLNGEILRVVEAVCERFARHLRASIMGPTVLRELEQPPSRESLAKARALVTAAMDTLGVHYHDDLPRLESLFRSHLRPSLLHAVRVAGSEITARMEDDTRGAGKKAYHLERQSAYDRTNDGAGDDADEVADGIVHAIDAFEATGDDDEAADDTPTLMVLYGRLPRVLAAYCRTSVPLREAFVEGLRSFYGSLRSMSTVRKRRRAEFFVFLALWVNCCREATLFQ